MAPTTFHCATLQKSGRVRAKYCSCSVDVGLLCVWLVNAAFCACFSFFSARLHVACVTLCHNKGEGQYLKLYPSWMWSRIDVCVRVSLLLCVDSKTSEVYKYTLFVVLVETIGQCLSLFPSPVDLILFVLLCSLLVRRTYPHQLPVTVSTTLHKINGHMYFTLGDFSSYMCVVF